MTCLRIRTSVPLSDSCLPLPPLLRDVTEKYRVATGAALHCRSCVGHCQHCFALSMVAAMVDDNGMVGIGSRVDVAITPC
jgi:hypothetical protein